MDVFARHPFDGSPYANPANRISQHDRHTEKIRQTSHAVVHISCLRFLGILRIPILEGLLELHKHSPASLLKDQQLLNRHSLCANQAGP